MTRHYKTNRKVSKKIDGYQTDTDSDVEPAPKKSRKERTRKSATKECKHLEDYNLSGDDDDYQARESIEHNEEYMFGSSDKSDWKHVSDFDGFEDTSSDSSDCEWMP